MEILDAVRCDCESADDEVAGDLKVVLEILNCESDSGSERRQFSRCHYVHRAALELVDPMGHVQRRPVFSRDANEWGVGLICRSPLPMGVSGLLQITGGDGIDVRARGCIIRCREVLPGWYEGALLFEHEQKSLSPQVIERRG